jgi:hypothetical protein
MKKDLTFALIDLGTGRKSTGSSGNFRSVHTPVRPFILHSAESISMGAEYERITGF